MSDSGEGLNLSDSIRDWIEASGYGAAIGVRVEALSDAQARLTLPYRDENSNPGRALHGGCAASLGVIGGQAVARAALGAEAGPFHTGGIQVNYLAAAIGEDIVATAKLLRRGKDMCFVEVDVATEAGKSIAHMTSMVRGRFGAPPVELPLAQVDDGESDPGPMGPHIGEMPYTKARGLDVEHMTGGHSRITMPACEANADHAGGVHEGAALALFDTTGAMAAWAETGPGRYKASTPALQAQFLAPPGAEDLVAYGRMIQRDGSALWSDVEVAEADSGRVVVRGTVLYRIVT